MKDSSILIKRTNKAELHRLADGSILKRYVTDNGPIRARQDQRSLHQLHTEFGNVEHNGWTYRVVKPLWVDADQCLVCMEMAAGRVIAEQPRSDMCESEFHAGVWLALYHNRTLNENLQGPIYTDFTVHNVLVDSEQRLVTAIDPGMGFPRFGSAYEDIVKHIHSVVVGLILRRRGPRSTIISFLKGYSTIASRKPRLLPYYRGFGREVLRQLRDYSKTSLARFVTFPIMIAVLSPLYLVVVPGYLCLRSERSKSRVPNK